jgi:hypothetical protein
MAEADRRPATVTRFCFVARAATSSRLLHNRIKEQPYRGGPIELTVDVASG